jgi:hypothetical protein
VIAEANFELRRHGAYHARRPLAQDHAAAAGPIRPAFNLVHGERLPAQAAAIQRAEGRQDVNTCEISFIGQRSSGPGYAEVHSSMLLKDRPTPVKVDYLLRQDGAQWRFYDLNIDAIS